MNDYLYLIKVDNLYGFINSSGEVVINPIYKNANNFSDGLAKVTSINGESFVINTMGEIIFKLQSNIYLNYENGFSSFRSGNKFGFINNKGEVVIEPKFDLVVSGFNKEGFAIIKENKRYGTINISGEYIIKPKYLSISKYKEHVLSVTNVNYKSGVIDKYDKIVIEFKFESIAEFSEGLACFSEKDKCGFINKNGEVVIEPKYHSLWGFHNGLSAFTLAPDEPFGFIDKNGNIKIENKYQTVGDFCDELAVFTNDDLSGYINKEGEEIIKNVFATAHDFKNGLAFVTTVEGEWGYINNKGEWVYKPKNFNLW